MIFDLFLFPVFIASMLSLGITFDYISARIIRHQGRLVEDISTLGFFGIFFIGILGVIANFFIPLSSPLFLTTIALMILAGFWLLVRQYTLISKPELIYMTIATVLMLPLASKMLAGYDGGLYHLPHQLWLREENIIIGLANFHDRFGFSSILEYAYAPLWVNENFKLLSYALASTGVFFITFLAAKAVVSKGPVLALILAIVINIAIFSEYLIWYYTYTDIPAGFLFATVFVYGFWMVYTDRMFSRREWAVFSLLTLFTILVKLSAAPLLLWGVFVLTYLLYTKKTSVREFLIGSSISAFLAIIWTIRGFMISGCLLFPVKMSCMDVSWAAVKNAQGVSNMITAWARHPRTGLTSLEDFSWFSEWWLPTHSEFLMNLMEAGLIVCGVYVALSAITKFKYFKLVDIRHLAATTIAIISIAFWFWKAPTPRFGIGAFIIFAPTLLIFIFGESNSSKYTKQLRVATLLFSVIFLIGINAQWKKIPKNKLINFNGLTVQTPDVKKDEIYGVRPLKGDRCWIVHACAPYGRPDMQMLYGFKAFVPDK